MSIWGGITGGLLGFVVLGPIGALVGSVIGSNISSRSKRRRPNNFDQQVAFFAALFACLAKIAKADGRVDEAEIKKIEEIISSKLNLNKEQIKNLSKTDLIEQILSDYIGKKVMSLEIEKLGVVVSDNALRDLIKNDKFYVQAGAGIVADSIPSKEYLETINKAKALMRAVD